MTPVLTRGYTFWDRAILPVDEFEERVRRVQEQMRVDDLQAIIIFSNTYHCSGDLAWLAGWPIGGGLVVLPEGEPRMYTFGGGRELFFQKSQIWLAHMTSVGADYGSALRAELEKLDAGGGTIGTVGLSDMPAAGTAMFEASFAGYTLRAYDRIFQGLREAKRPREQLVIEAALEIAEAAEAAARDAFEAGEGPTGALIEAERVARMRGALDFRGLANIDGKHLRPFEGLSTLKCEKLLLWGAVNYHGCWADVALDTGAPGLAARSVTAMVDTVRAGVTAGDVAAAALAVLPDEAIEQTLSFGFGGGIGQTLDETPLIRPGSEAGIPEGAILSLRAFVPGDEDASLAGTIVRIERDRAVRLLSR
jgi:Xaa-Pro aminopeptidase